MSEQPLILVTNDDGIQALGIRTLIEAVRPLGRVVVVAPEKPQSSMGHALTLDMPIRIEKVSYFADLDVEASYQCSGTPVDCVKFAVNHLLKERPAICVSGINHGLNHSINVIYSGTLSAAMEAALENIPAIGFSYDHPEPVGDFGVARYFAYLLTRWLLEFRNELPEQTFLNVNIPRLSLEKIRGVRICRQGYGRWEEKFEERTDPRGRKYYWLSGRFLHLEKHPETDLWALEHGYVSVVPVTLDFTAYSLLPQLQRTWVRFASSDLSLQRTQDPTLKYSRKKQ